jgi:DNA modification methylase
MDINKVYLGDSAEVLKTFPSDCIDLTVTSPPYGSLRDYKNFSFNFQTIALELYRVTKPGGVVVWVVGDQVIDGSETGTPFVQALFFKNDCGFNIHDTMIYSKNGPAHPEKTRYQQVFEFMFVFSKGLPKTVNLITDHKNRWAGTKNWGTRSNREVNGDLGSRSLSGQVVNKVGVRWNIWDINTGYKYSTSDPSAFGHPAIFPEALAEGHILSWSDPGDIVLDCFMGSGTVGKMAHMAGRAWVGIEISQEYADLAKRRIAAAPDPLFV